MGLFQRVIKRSKQRVWAYGPGPDLPVSSPDEATMADEAGLEADQHRVRHSRRIVDRTRDLSAVRDGDYRPVLDLGQEDESNEGMSSDYVGNSNVSNVLTDFSGPGASLYIQDSQSDTSHSEKLESDRCVVKNGIQISDPQSCKAQETESENEQVELDAGEETGLPKGNRTGPVADILLPGNQTKISPPQREPAEPYQQHGTPDMDADGMLFSKVPLMEKKSVPEKGSHSAVSMDAALAHPDIPAGVRRALGKLQADFTGQPDGGVKNARPAQGIPPQKVSIGRVSVRVKLPDAAVPAQKPAPPFSADKLVSRYFMGDA